MARLSPPSVVGRGGTILSVNTDTIGSSPGHFGSNPPNAREATRKRSLDKEVELPNSFSDVESDTMSCIEPIQAGKPGDVNVPASKRRIVSTPRQGGHEACIPSQSDTSEQVHTLVNGVTGNIEGEVSLAAIPSLHALLEQYEMSIYECGRALKAGDLSEMVVIRPMVELN